MLWPVVASGFRLALVGVAIGVLGSMLVGRSLAALLFQVRALDVGVIAGVATLLLAIAVLASYIPARRAALIEPMQALRSE